MIKPSRLMVSLVVALSLIISTPRFPVAAATPPPYVLLDLGTLGGQRSDASDLNDRGEVVGAAETATINPTTPPSYELQGFVYDSRSGAPLHAIANDPCEQRGFPANQAMAINNAGTIVGAGTVGPDCFVGGLFVYRNGQKTFLDIPGNSVDVFDFNDADQILGVRTTDQETVTFIYADGVVRDLPISYEGNPYHWMAFNDAGTLVGHTFIGSLTQHAAISAGSAYRDIHDALGFPDFPNSTASAINNRGQVAGTLSSGGRYGPAASRAFIYDPATGAVQDLGAGGVTSLNDVGQAVGSRGYEQPVLFGDGQVRDLDSLIAPGSGWQMVTATRINNLGQIIGLGRRVSDGALHGILLSPRLFDVPASSPYRAAIVALTDQGVIRGYEDGRFAPDEYALRAQSAAFITRAVGWDTEDWRDQDFPDRGVIDDDLWRNVRTLAHHRVALGYADGTYNPTGAVLHEQVIIFITRAMLAKGYWVEQPDTGAYPNLPNASAREQADRRSVATYIHYAGALPDRPLGQSWLDWNTPAPRGWFAQVLWQAL